jgi:hypothetical protein
MADKKNPDPWAIPDIGPETDEIGPATGEKQSEGGAAGFDATQWHEVKKGETLWKIAERTTETAAYIKRSSQPTATFSRSRTELTSARSSAFHEGQPT